MLIPATAWHSVDVPAHTAELYPGDIKSVLLSEVQIRSKTAELGEQIGIAVGSADPVQDR